MTSSILWGISASSQAHPYRSTSASELRMWQKQYHKLFMCLCHFLYIFTQKNFFDICTYVLWMVCRFCLFQMQPDEIIIKLKVVLEFFFLKRRKKQMMTRNFKKHLLLRTYIHKHKKFIKKICQKSRIWNVKLLFCPFWLVAFLYFFFIST